MPQPRPPLPLQACTAPELSSLLHAVAVLRLRPPPGWLEGALAGALLQELPRAGLRVRGAGAERR